MTEFGVTSSFMEGTQTTGGLKNEASCQSNRFRRL
jgi:hypothetical protein